MAYLKVLTAYQGADTHGLRVLPGVYASGHEHLHGADEAALVADGIAERVDEPETEAVEEVTSEAHPEWEKTSNKQIAAWLEERGYDVTGWKTKADLIAIYGEDVE